jgi:hypothetical protein
MTGRGALERQVDRLVALGYPGLAGVTEHAFRSLAARLSAPAEAAVEASVDGAGRWVLVVSESVVPPGRAVPLLRLEGSERPGVLDANHGPEGLAPYRPIEAVDVPSAPMYLLLGVERGDEYRGVAPQDALPQVLARGRTPLTVAEGLALVTQRPGVLVRNHCFSLAGSRRGDKRVPALWISAGAAKLGWCWDGNPHDWLGLASAASRSA